SRCSFLFRCTAFFFYCCTVWRGSCFVLLLRVRRLYLPNVFSLTRLCAIYRSRSCYTRSWSRFHWRRFRLCRHRASHPSPPGRRRRKLPIPGIASHRLLDRGSLPQRCDRFIFCSLVLLCDIRLRDTRSKLPCAF